MKPSRPLTQTRKFADLPLPLMTGFPYDPEFFAAASPSRASGAAGTEGRRRGPGFPESHLLRPKPDPNEGT